jgi:hypothetical protein
VAALLTVYRGGDIVGRCDAKCYLATCKDCDCICTGLNHSAGLQRATDQTRALAEEWVQRARAEGRIDAFGLDPTTRQDPLF